MIGIILIVVLVLGGAGACVFFLLRSKAAPAAPTAANNVDPGLFLPAEPDDPGTGGSPARPAGWTRTLPEKR